MPISNLKGHRHSFSTSSTLQDSTTAESMVFSWPLLSPHGASRVMTEFYDDIGEANDTNTWSTQNPKQPARREWTKSPSFVPFAEAIAYYTLAACGSGTSVSSSPIGATGIYLHTPTVLRTSLTKVIAFTAQEDEIGGTANTLNQIVHNVMVESVTIAGTRGNPLTVTANLRGGGKVATAGGDAGTSAPARSKVLRHNHCALFYNPTAGYNSTNATAGFEASAPATGSSALTASGLVDLSSYMAGFSITFDNPVDAGRSYNAGSSDSDGAAIIGSNGDYIEGGPQSITLEVTFDHEDTTEALAILAAQTAGTQCGLELWALHPVDQGSGASAYTGFKFTLPAAAALASDQSDVSDDVGTKSITHRFKAEYTTSGSLNSIAKILTASKISQTLWG